MAPPFLSLRPAMKAVSLFSGCGGFDWGAQEAGLEIIWANDHDPVAAAAYQRLFPDVEFHEEDIRNIHDFPEAEVLIGCYPCTGFSVGSRRRWRGEERRDLRDDDGNFLYTEFLRALEQVKPKYLFVENVRGMLTAANGWFLKKQIEGFEAAGFTVSKRLLNAASHGVPQTRQRVFIVGVRNDVDFDYRFPDPSHGPGMESDFATLRDALDGMPDWPEGEYFDYEFHGHYLTRQRKRGWYEPSYTIVANKHHVPLHPMGEPMRFVEKDSWELQGDVNRRLSWRECAAIQALPEEIELEGGLTANYRVVGNAVPSPLGRVLIEPIIRFERGEEPAPMNDETPPSRSAGDPLSRADRSRVMASIGSKDTKPELALRKELWHRGFRYLTNWRVAGVNVDIVFTRPRLAVFVDGCFWHACPRHYSTPGTNRDYWKQKIERNQERDAENTERLEDSGWTVLRLWECDVMGDVPAAADTVIENYRLNIASPS